MTRTPFAPVKSRASSLLTYDPEVGGESPNGWAELAGLAELESAADRIDSAASPLVKSLIGWHCWDRTNLVLR